MGSHLGREMTHLGPLRRPSMCFKHHSLVFQSSSLLQCAQSCLTLCDPTDYSLPGSSVHGIFQARMLGWVAISFSRGSSRPGDRTHVFCFSWIAGGFFTTGITWEVRLQSSSLALSINRGWVKLTWITAGGRLGRITTLHKDGWKGNGQNTEPKSCPERGWLRSVSLPHLRG